MANYSDVSYDIAPVVRAMDVVITIAGVLGNSLVCVTFLYNNKGINHSSMNKLILHQSIIDLTAVIIFFFARVVFHPEYVDVPTASIASQIYCRIWYTDYILWSMYYTSTFNLMLIAIERYVVSCHVIWYRNISTRFRRLVKFGYAIPWLLGFGSQIYVLVLGNAWYGWCLLIWASSARQAAGGIVLFLLMFLLPITVMTWCDAKVTLTLIKREKAHRQAGRNDNALKRSKNAASTLVIITVAYVVCCLPSEVDFLLYNLGLNNTYGSVVYYICSLLTSLNMVVNPCIYTCAYSLFQRRLRNLFCRGDFRRRNVIINVIAQRMAWP